MLNTKKKDNVIYPFKKDTLILRDLLATDRTALANERTLLAYVRTALSLIVAGSSFIKFSDMLLIEVIGYILVPMGIIIGTVGLYRFIVVSKDLKKIKNCSNYHIE
ncbi:MAG: DUF202 domain-containing protein [Vallitalea sp.]|jgi:putative membrane protein|nr:DUF202 domain-containing protein [Vallitalea sp.]